MKSTKWKVILPINLWLMNILFEYKFKMENAKERKKSDLADINMSYGRGEDWNAWLYFDISSMLPYNTHISTDL